MAAVVGAAALRGCPVAKRVKMHLGCGQQLQLPASLRRQIESPQLQRSPLLLLLLLKNSKIRDEMIGRR